MRILITGGTGQVGAELGRFSWPEGVEPVCPGRLELDLSDPEGIRHHVTAGGYAAVINAGAFTAVDRAEAEIITAFRVNALAPAALAQATREAGIPLVQVSTDYVFDGCRSGPWQEGDAIGPLSVYGASKEAGEQAVRTGNPRHVILRTAWVFSSHGANFVRTMLRLGGDRSLLRIVDDQAGCPTAAGDLAAALASITLRLIEDRNAPVGTGHFVNAGATTWCGFARAIFRHVAAAGRDVPEIVPIPTREYPTPARRPANSVLSTTWIQQAYGLVPRPWEEALADVMDVLLRPPLAK